MEIKTRAIPCINLFIKNQHELKRKLNLEKNECMSENVELDINKIL